MPHFEIPDKICIINMVSPLWNGPQPQESNEWHILGFHGFSGWITDDVYINCWGGLKAPTRSNQHILEITQNTDLVVYSSSRGWLPFIWGWVETTSKIYCWTICIPIVGWCESGSKNSTRNLIGYNLKMTQGIFSWDTVVYRLAVESPQFE